MEDSLTKIKNNVKKSLHRKSKDRASSSDGTPIEDLLNKPLPASPQQYSATSKPTVRQVNAFKDEQDGGTVHLRPRSSKAAEAPRQQLLPEIGFGKLTIDDLDDTVHNNQEADPSESEANTLSSIIPNRRSSKNFAPNRDHTVDGSHSLNNSPTAERVVKRTSLPPAAQLPPGFKLGNTVDTSIETTQAPAVTHEVLHKHTEEIIHERIIRDIHVDHYYKYIQPIKEVIINPAVHFTVDERGNKVSIPTPDCWDRPPGFTPTPDDSDRGAKLAEMVRGVQAQLGTSHQKSDSGR